MSNPDLLQVTIAAINNSLSSISDLLGSGGLSIGTTTGQAPIGATIVARSSGNTANASAQARMPAVSGKTNYITGFDVYSTGSTAAFVTQVTISGLLGGSLVFSYANVIGPTLLSTPLSIRFPGPIPGLAVNTALNVTLPALGSGNTSATVNVYGYVL
jgi:hypothetical protein